MYEEWFWQLWPRLRVQVCCKFTTFAPRIGDPFQGPDAVCKAAPEAVEEALKEQDGTDAAGLNSSEHGKRDKHVEAVWFTF